MKRTRTRFYPSTYNHSPFRGLGGILMLLLPLFFSCRPLHYSERRAQLDSLQRANQADTVFRSDSLQRILVDYFDRHGTADDRMLAHYLLGRAYYDMGEMPAALQSYLTAVEDDSTDNKSTNNCELLAKIHAQTARTYSAELMHNDALAEYRKARMCALAIGDTLLATIYSESQIHPFYSLGLNDSILALSSGIFKSYKKWGKMNMAARSVSTAIYILLERGNVSQAKDYLSFYEEHADIFDENGCLKRPGELYYCFKGLYHLVTGQNDSAEFYFRKDIGEKTSLNNKVMDYSGLLRVYEKRHMSDSVMKYSRLYADANDSLYANVASEATVHVKSVYQYQRNERIAYVSVQKAKKERLTVRILLLTIIIVVVFFYLLYRRVKASQRRRMADENRRYNDLLDRLAESEQTILRLEANASEQGEADQSMNDELEKERLVSAGLREELSVYEEDGNVQWSLKESLIETPAVVRLHELACHGKAASDRAKGMLRKVVEDRQPSFYAHVMSPARKLTELEQTVSILIRLQFARSEISTLLDKSPQQVTNICSSINEKLFGRKGTKQLDSSLRQL